jgi:signal transduction histidine kinase
VQDVTQRRIAEETLDKVRSELAHVARVMSLGQLTASIAHEVSQPLSGIITNASTCLRMLALEPPDIEGALKTAQRTLRDGNRASEVLARLRALFRKKDAALEAVDLNEAAEEVVALSAQDLQRRGIAIQTVLDGTLPRIEGDRVQLQQVILNLVLNAADAMDGIEDRPRRIVVETGAGSPEPVRLTVRDTGQGLPDGDAARVFDAFYTTKADGMGIGLSVSRSIIDRHGGRLWAGPNDGPGAAFSFALPQAAVVPAGVSPAPAPAAGPQGAGPS